MANDEGSTNLGKRNLTYFLYSPQSFNLGRRELTPTGREKILKCKRCAELGTCWPRDQVHQCWLLSMLIDYRAVSGTSTFEIWNLNANQERMKEKFFWGPLTDCMTSYKNTNTLTGEEQNHSKKFQETAGYQYLSRYDSYSRRMALKGLTSWLKAFNCWWYAAQLHDVITSTDWLLRSNGLDLWPISAVASTTNGWLRTVTTVISPPLVSLPRCVYELYVSWAAYFPGFNGRSVTPAGFKFASMDEISQVIIKVTTSKRTGKKYVYGSNLHVDKLAGFNAVQMTGSSSNAHQTVLRVLV